MKVYNYALVMQPLLQREHEMSEHLNKEIFAR